MPSRDTIQESACLELFKWLNANVLTSSVITNCVSIRNNLISLYDDIKSKVKQHSKNHLNDSCYK